MAHVSENAVLIVYIVKAHFFYPVEENKAHYGVGKLMNGSAQKSGCIADATASARNLVEKAVSGRLEAMKLIDFFVQL